LHFVVDKRNNEFKMQFKQGTDAGVSRGMTSRQSVSMVQAPDCVQTPCLAKKSLYQQA